jgi:hypothetical protein
MTARLAIPLLAIPAWAAGVHLAFGLDLPSLLMFGALVAAGAFGIGYELADAGTAATLFLTLAGMGVIVTTVAVANGLPQAGMGFVFATPTALIGAAVAYAAGTWRETCS